MTRVEKLESLLTLVKEMRENQKTYDRAKTDVFALEIAKRREKQIDDLIVELDDGSGQQRMF